jgi:hypothetical protein
MPAAHRAWLDALLRDTGAERLVADTFPGGIQGELCGLDIPLDLVARLLRWDEYRRCVSTGLPHLQTTWTVEQLTPPYDSWVHANSEKVVPLDLAPAAPAGIPLEPYWLVVHSGPEEEVRELIAHAAELMKLATEPPQQILVATRCNVELPAGFSVTDVYPASQLFPAASRIISAAGFNVMLETEPWADKHPDKHEVVPFPRRFDDQYTRAARRRQRRSE